MCVFEETCNLTTVEIFMVGTLFLTIFYIYTNIIQEDFLKMEKYIKAGKDECELDFGPSLLTNVLVGKGK